MKRLLLIRHAKAEQGTNTADFERPAHKNRNAGFGCNGPKD